MKLIDVLNEHKDADGKLDNFATVLLLSVMTSLVHSVLEIDIDEKLLEDIK